VRTRNGNKNENGKVGKLGYKDYERKTVERLLYVIHGWNRDTNPLQLLHARLTKLEGNERGFSDSGVGILIFYTVGSFSTKASLDNV